MLRELTTHAQPPAHLQRQLAPHPHKRLSNRTIPSRCRRAPLPEFRTLLPRAPGSTLPLRALGRRQHVASALPKLADARDLPPDELLSRLQVSQRRELAFPGCRARGQLVAPWPGPSGRTSRGAGLAVMVVLTASMGSQDCWFVLQTSGPPACRLGRPLVLGTPLESLALLPTEDINTR